MANNGIPVAPIGANIKLVAWPRCNRELTGRSGRSYIHGASQLLMQSYTEIEAVPHEYHIIIGTLCQTRASHATSYPLMRMIYELPDVAEGLLDRGVLPILQRSFSGLGVSAMEFDTKGSYLASVTRSGCLSVHKYEALYNHRQGEDEKEPAWHGFLADQGIHAVRWNPIDQSEIAYATRRSDELKLFDLGFSHATSTLRKRPTANAFFLKGLSDIAFVNEGTRVLASDLVGEVSMWDLRAGDLPQMVLTSEKNISLNSIQLHGSQFVCGASKSGFIHTWDLRGGRASDSSQSDSEEHPPLTSINLKSMLNKLRPPRPRAKIWQMDIQSININPSCAYQLGFHLADGCSGVFDMHTSRVSHIHCAPPPPWMSNSLVPVLPSRRPSWLQQSIYAAASSSSSGLYLLDFHPHHSSPFHVDNVGSKSPQERAEHEQGVFVPLSSRATACATHPLDGTIVVGTMNASLLLVSQENLSKKGDGEEDDDSEDE